MVVVLNVNCLIILKKHNFVLLFNLNREKKNLIYFLTVTLMEINLDESLIIFVSVYGM